MKGVLRPTCIQSVAKTEKTKVKSRGREIGRNNALLVGDLTKFSCHLIGLLLGTILKYFYKIERK